MNLSLGNIHRYGKIWRTAIMLWTFTKLINWPTFLKWIHLFSLINWVRLTPIFTDSLLSNTIHIITYTLIISHILIYFINICPIVYYLVSKHKHQKNNVYLYSNPSNRNSYKSVVSFSYIIHSLLTDSIWWTGYVSISLLIAYPVDSNIRNCYINYN